MGYPAPGRRTLGRVARAAQHGRVADVYRRTAGGERDDVIDGQVRRSVGGTEVARAPVTVLATPGAQHAGAEPLPGSRALQRVVPAPVGLPGVLGAATTSAAGDDTTDRAQLHPQIVRRLAGAVYSPAVLRLRGQSQTELAQRVTRSRAQGWDLSRRSAPTRVRVLARPGSGRRSNPLPARAGRRSRENTGSTSGRWRRRPQGRA
jgi:hypothetical protein